MAQIALIPQIQGDKLKNLTSTDGDDFVTQISVDGEIIGVTFDQALQELLMAQGEEGIVLFSIATSTGDPVQLQALTPQDGRVLPLQVQVDGKSLPVQVSQQQAVLAELAALRPVQLEPLQPQPQLQGQVNQPEILMQRLIENPQLQPMKMPLSGEIGAQLLESVRTVETTGQSSTVSLHSVASSSTGIRPSIVMPLDIPVGQAGWGRAMGDRIQWMVGHNIQQAEIKLNPPHLGPLEIKISLQNDQTNVTFLATQAPTRDALEASIPRLREMFGEVNLNLANVDVGQQQGGQSTHDRRASTDAEGVAGADSSGQESTSATQPSRWVVGSDGLLDTYA
jgi:flagellar hook-length control protein FliK